MRDAFKSRAQSYCEEGSAVIKERHRTGTRKKALKT